MTEKPVNYARGARGNFDLIVAIFCSLLLISNICATKLIPLGSLNATPITFGSIQIWPLLTDGGALLFPFTYIFGDVLAEVFGLKQSRRAIWLGFGVSLLASCTFLIIGAAPALNPDVNQAFSTVLGFVPRIVVASLLGYLGGQFVNAWVLTAMKSRTHEGTLWARLLGSTVVGELIDTVTFCFIAFGGIITKAEMINYIAVGYVWKVLVETAFLPITYWVIKLVKKGEPDYWNTSDVTSTTIELMS
ncbi:MAG: queuosine precursor transporter [Propionibacteriaceae bacterium]